MSRNPRKPPSPNLTRTPEIHLSEFGARLYCVQTIPQLSQPQGSAASFPLHLYWERYEYNAALGAAIVIQFLIGSLWLRSKQAGYWEPRSCSRP